MYSHGKFIEHNKLPATIGTANIFSPALRNTRVYLALL